MHRTSKRALAASFVVTFAAPCAVAGASGCDAKSTQPPAAPTVDVGPGPVPSASSAGGVGPTTAIAQAGDAAAAATAPTLPPAPTFGHVNKSPDGTCMWMPDRPPPRTLNGRIIPMNPPPPHAVQCPDDAGN